MEPSVVVEPSPKHRVEHEREIAKLLVTLQLEMPSPDGLPHHLEGVPADRRREVHVNPAIFVHRFPRSKRIAQECERRSRIVSRSIDILAVDDPRFLRVQFQTTLSKTLADPSQR